MVVDASAGATTTGAARTHALDELHVALVGQSLLLKHLTHVLLATLQDGVDPLQSELTKQPLTTVNVFKLLDALVTAKTPDPLDAVAVTV